MATRGACGGLLSLGPLRGVPAIEVASNPTFRPSLALQGGACVGTLRPPRGTAVLGSRRWRAARGGRAVLSLARCFLRTCPACPRSHAGSRALALPEACTDPAGAAHEADGPGLLTAVDGLGLAGESLRDDAPACLVGFVVKQATSSVRLGAVSALPELPRAWLCSRPGTPARVPGSAAAADLGRPLALGLLPLSEG